MKIEYSDEDDLDFFELHSVDEDDPDDTCDIFTMDELEKWIRGVGKYESNK